MQTCGKVLIIMYELKRRRWLEGLGIALGDMVGMADEISRSLKRRDIRSSSEAQCEYSANNGQDIREHR